MQDWTSQVHLKYSYGTSLVNYRVDNSVISSDYSEELIFWIVIPRSSPSFSSVDEFGGPYYCDGFFCWIFFLLVPQRIWFRGGSKRRPLLSCTSIYHVSLIESSRTLKLVHSQCTLRVICFKCRNSLERYLEFDTALKDIISHYWGKTLGREGTQYRSSLAMHWPLGGGLIKEWVHIFIREGSQLESSVIVWIREGSQLRNISHCMN